VEVLVDPGVGALRRQTRAELDVLAPGGSVVGVSGMASVSSAARWSLDEALPLPPCSAHAGHRFSATSDGFPTCNSGPLGIKDS
jgi:hypothetical protein